LDKRAENLQLIIDTGVVAVIRANTSAQLMDIVQALKNGGIRALEITMTTPNALEAIEEAAERFGKEVVVGVGTVLDPETARAAILAGAEFIVAPTLNLEVIKLCKRYSKLVVPGAFTPTEILTAWEAGADAVKVFPATKLGPEFFKDVLGPLPQVRLTPTGGVNLQTTPQFIKAGAAFVGVGTALVDKKMVAEKRWDDLAALAGQYLDAVRQARS